MKPGTSLKLFGLLMTCLSSCATASLAATSDEASARAFLEAIYARYHANGQPIAATDRDADTIYAPALLTLIKDDEKAVNGEVGVLDGDPICNCQDFDIRHVDIVLHPLAAGHLQAIAAFKNLDQHESMRFDLVPVAGSWRIADIDIPEMGSLSAALKAEIDAAPTPNSH